MTQGEMDLKVIETELREVSAEQHRLARLAGALREARTRLHVGIEPGFVATQLERERARIAGAGR